MVCADVSVNFIHLIRDNIDKIAGLFSIKVSKENSVGSVDIRGAFEESFRENSTKELIIFEAYTFLL